VSGRQRVALALALLGALTVIVAVLPIRIESIPAGAVTPSLVSGALADENAAWRAEDVMLRITTTEDGPVSLMRPQQPYGFAVPAEWFDVDGWQPTADATGFATDVAGASLTLSGQFSALELLFWTGPDSPPIDIEVNGVVTTLDLASSTPSTAPFHVVSGAPIETKSQRFGFSPISARAPTDGCAEATVFVVRAPISTVEACDGAPIGAGSAELLGWIARILGRAAITLALVLAALAVFSLIGYAVLHRVGARPPAVFGVTAALTGTAVVLAAVGVLNYVAPVRVLVVLVLGAALAASVDVYRHRPQRWSEGMPFTAALAVSTVVCIAFAFTDRTGVGLLQTDIYEYQRLAQLFWGEGAIPSDSDFGNGMRLIDSSARSLFYGTTGGRATVALLVLHAVGLALMAAATAALVGTRRPRAAVWVAVVSAFGGAMTSLFVEGFLSRSFMATFLVAGWCAAASVVAGEDDEGDRRGRLISAGASLGIAAAIVPMYILPALAPAALLIAPLGRARQRVQPVLPLIGAFLAVALPNLFWMRKPDVAAEYASGVNELGKNIVLPFHGRPTMFNALTGIEAVHVNPLSLMGTTSNALPVFVTDYLEFLSEHALAVACLTAVVIMALVVWRPPSDTDDPLVRCIRWTWALLVGSFVAFLPLWSTQSYFVLMYLWTVAPLGLVALLVRATAARGATARVLVAAATGLALCNTIVTGVEMSRWAELPRSTFDTRWRFDVGPELASVRRWINSTEPGSYVMRVAESQVFLTDDGRVLANLVDQELVAAGFECLNCERARPSRSLVLPPSDPTAADASRYEIVVGSRTCSERAVHSTEHLAICEGPP
jgi:hypothetical protein